MENVVDSKGQMRFFDELGRKFHTIVLKGKLDNLNCICIANAFSHVVYIAIFTLQLNTPTGRIVLILTYCPSSVYSFVGRLHLRLGLSKIAGKKERVLLKVKKKRLYL